MMELVSPEGDKEAKGLSLHHVRKQGEGNCLESGVGP